jgi:hypothetical protein
MRHCNKTINIGPRLTLLWSNNKIQVTQQQKDSEYFNTHLDQTQSQTNSAVS